MDNNFSPDMVTVARLLSIIEVAKQHGADINSFDLNEYEKDCLLWIKNEERKAKLKKIENA
jgi:hypothetical protein